MRHRVSSVTAVLSAVVFSTAAWGQDADQSLRRSLTVEQAAIYDVRPADEVGGLRVKVWADRPDYTYAIGEQVRLFLESNQDAYVAVLSTDPAGKTTVLFPNSHQSSNFVRAGNPVEVPDPGAPIRIGVSRPVGTELIKVVASARPFSVGEALDVSETGAFSEVRSSAASTARSLSVVMAGDRTRPSAAPTLAADLDGRTQPQGAGGGAAGSVAVTNAAADDWTICHQVIKTIPTPTTQRARLSRSLRVEDRRNRNSGSSVQCEEL